MTSEEKKFSTEDEYKPIEAEDDFGRKFVADFDGHYYEVYPNLAVLPEDWWIPLWELYDTSLYIPESIQEQRAYDRDTFMKALIDPEYIKVVAFQDQKLMGFVLGTANLEKARVNYINPDFLWKDYPDAAKRKRILYMSAGYFSPELRVLGFLNHLISLIARTIEQNCEGFVSDVCVQRMFLKDAIKFGAERAGGSHQAGGYSRHPDLLCLYSRRVKRKKLGFLPFLL